MSGLVRPTQGSVSVLGILPSDPERLFKVLGYSTQFDSFLRGLTGFQFVYSFLRLFGYSSSECRKLTTKAIDLVRMGEAADPEGRGIQQGDARIRNAGRKGDFATIRRCWCWMSR